MRLPIEQPEGSVVQIPVGEKTELSGQWQLELGTDPAGRPSGRFSITTLNGHYYYLLLGWEGLAMLRGQLDRAHARPENGDQ